MYSSSLSTFSIQTFPFLVYGTPPLSLSPLIQLNNICSLRYLYITIQTLEGSFFHFTEIIKHGIDAAEAAVVVSCFLRLMRQRRS